MSRARVPVWVPWTGVVLALAGLGVSIYLTLAHYDSAAVQLSCPDRGLVNCTKVTTSPQSMVFGVIPVAVLGLPFFAGMLVLQSPPAWNSPRRLVTAVRLGSVLAGIGFVCYLVYTEFFTLNAVCLWCTSVHVITLLLFILTVLGSALAAPAPEEGAAALR